MHRINYIIHFILLILVSGCVSGPDHPINSKPNAITPPYQIEIKPVLSGWDMPDDTQIYGNGWILYIYGFRLAQEDTILLYTLSNGDSNHLITKGSLQVVDDTGRISQLYEILPLARLGQLEMGLMRFESRVEGARELFLEINTESDNEGVLNVMFAQFYSYDPSAELDRLYSTYYFGSQIPKEWEQAGYQLSFWGWGIPPDLPVPGRIEWPVQTPEKPGTLPTPVPDILAPWIEVTQGVASRNEATLRIQDLETGKIYYLAMQMLSDGQVLGFFNGLVVIPIPIPGATPVEIIPLNTYPTP